MIRSLKKNDDCSGQSAIIASLIKKKKERDFIWEEEADREEAPEAAAGAVSPAVPVHPVDFQADRAAAHPEEEEAAVLAVGVVLGAAAHQVRQRAGRPRRHHRADPLHRHRHRHLTTRDHTGHSLHQGHPGR